MAKKCQVCSGPIVNGKCKLCGMPYRNDDEIFYHVNESRRAHYKHSNDNVRKKMREQETPIFDRKRSEIENENPNAVQTLGSVLRAEAKNRTQKMNNAYGEQKKKIQPKINRYAPTFASKERTAEQKKMKSTDPANQKKSVLSKIIIIFAIISAAAQLFGTYGKSLSQLIEENTTWSELLDGKNNKNEIQFDNEEIWYDEEEEDWGDKADYRTLEEVLAETADNEFLPSFYMYPEDAKEFINGMSPYTILTPNSYKTGLTPGYYMAVIEKSFATFHISGKYGTASSHLSRYNNYLVFELAEGERIELQDPGSEDAQVSVYLLFNEIEK